MLLPLVTGSCNSWSGPGRSHWEEEGMNNRMLNTWSKGLPQLEVALNSSWPRPSQTTCSQRQAQNLGHGETHFLSEQPDTTKRSHNGYAAGADTYMVAIFTFLESLHLPFDHQHNYYDHLVESCKYSIPQGWVWNAIFKLSQGNFL